MKLTPNRIKVDHPTLASEISYYSWGNPAAERVLLLIHGNCADGSCWQPLAEHLAPTCRLVAPDLAGYGGTVSSPLDAATAVQQWSADAKYLLDKLYDGNCPQIDVVSWSLGSAVALEFACANPELVASNILINPISPFGWGATKDLIGTPCWDDYAGSGGGLVNPAFVTDLVNHNRADEPTAPLGVLRAFILGSPVSPEMEQSLLDAMFRQKTNMAGFYPGGLVPSNNWPGLAPGADGPLNAVSPKYFNIAQRLIAQNRKSPVLWIRGETDAIVSDTSLFDAGQLGVLGFIPGHPGNTVYPPQPMVQQTRAVLERYGNFREIAMPGGHGLPVTAPAQVAQAILEFWSAPAATSSRPIPERNKGPVGSLIS